MKKIIVLSIALLLVAGFAYAQTYKVTDDTVDNDETSKVVERTVTVPETTVVDTIDMAAEIRAMEADKKDIESILIRFNSHKDKYNDGLVGIGSATKPLSDATASFPVIPAIVVPE